MLKKMSTLYQGVLWSSMVNCFNHNQGVLGLSHTGSSWFFVEVSLGNTLHNPSPVLVKLGKDMNNVCSCNDMIERLLKVG